MNREDSLYNKIVSRENIYNAIYCMESYVFEKGLLNTTDAVCDSNGEIILNNDLELYFALSDKFEMPLISRIIEICQHRLERILKEKDELFTVTVYFKAKNVDEGKINYRPMHTARLIDLICMVSILNLLMFDDNGYTRKLSDLSKLLPHNFYGNIPSTDVRYLFQKWQHKYKEYTDNVLMHCRSYQNSHNYHTEVCLDIKNFFPSIQPKFVYRYILDKLSATYKDEDEQTLKIAVLKLLYFKVRQRNIEPWCSIYYGEQFKPESDFYLNRGIAQGLPQSYFFGNLCMIEIKKILMEKDCFFGDAYFYVDDSVIYIESELDKEEFQRRIIALNDHLKKWCEEENEKPCNIEEYVSRDVMDFQDKQQYIISFHEEGKSVYCPIDIADNQLGGVENLARGVSLTSSLSLTIDEIDDRVSLKKLEALDSVITREIGKLEKVNDKKEGKRDDGFDVRNSSRLKRLKRFKKFFLYRLRLLKMKIDGGPSESMFDDFKKRFVEKESVEDWFVQNEEDIFQTEYQLLIQKETNEEAQKIYTAICDLEKTKLVEQGQFSNQALNYLFFSKDAECSLKMKELSADAYKSLRRWAKINLSGLKGLDQDRQMQKFRDFVSGSENAFSMANLKKDGFLNDKSNLFVINASADYQRKLLNTYFSVLTDVDVSDVLSFTKLSSRRMRYTELRILAYLRNRNFNMEQFKIFLTCIDEKDVSNRMGIDMGLLEVLNIFINKTRKPEWVDNLILTHRVTKGLWYNGSKFLNSYTLHNEEHAVTLINKSIEIVNRIDYFVLKDVDYYILFLACYLHDISMVIHPDLSMFVSDNEKNYAKITGLMNEMQDAVRKFFDIPKEDPKNVRIKDGGNFILKVFEKVYEYFENMVRDNHPAESAKFIIDKSNTLLAHLTPTLLSYVAKVSESHGYDVMEIYGLKSKAKDDTVSLKYLMMIIRLADLMDVSNDRVNYHLLRQNLKNLSPTSKFHWISHLVTDKIELNTNYISDEKRDIEDKPITEDINFDLHLNVKYLTSIENRNKCKCCQCNIENNSLCVEIKSGHPLKHLCDAPNCVFLCRWMMKKHEWLIPELAELNDYLYSVNNSLIRTNINFNICYNDDMRLDADMFDYVRNYLETNNV